MATATRFSCLLAAFALSLALPIGSAFAATTDAQFEAALKAKSSTLPWKKMGHAEDGLALIDKALALLQPAHDTALLNRSPVSLQTRFTAASTFLGMPGLFNRGARGTKLLAEVQSSPVLAQASPGFQGAVLMTAAQVAAKEFRTADARRDLNVVIQRGLPQAEAAKAQLQGLPQ